MSAVTPVSSIPAQNVNTGAVTLTAKYGRLEVILDAAGATSVQLLVQGEGGDWMLEGSQVSVDSTRDIDGGKAVVYFPVRQPGSRYHAYCPNAPTSYRAYISAAADAATTLAALSGNASDIADILGTDGTHLAGATGRAADAGHVHVLSATCLAVAPVIGNTTPAAGTFTTLTIAANYSLVGVTGTGGLSCGSMTGATALPTGNVSWAGAATKTVSLVSTGGAMTFTAGAASTWKTSSGALTLDSAAALNLGTGDSTSQSAGKSGTIWTFNGKVAYGANAQTIADPGDSGAIAVTANGMCALTSAGAETRTLAIPSFAGQQLAIICDTYVGNIVITSAQAINQAGNNTMTFGVVNDSIFLVAMTIGGALRWRVVGNDGVALSTV